MSVDAQALKERLLTDNVLEVIKPEELEAQLTSGRKDLKAYIGFEPSGIAHIAWKMMVGKVIDLTNCGYQVTILLADWHAYINDKLAGDIQAIKTCGAYMEDCFKAFGVDQDRTKFVYCSGYIDDPRYWELVLRSAKANSLQRMKRALTIMGRQEDEADLDASKLIYPAMQVADIFYLDVDVALGGMDQRKAHMLAREVAPKVGRKTFVALHTHLIAGLAGAEGRMAPEEAKMSKSKPDSAIFIHDAPEEVDRKMKKAFCPQGQVDGNPVLQMARHLVFSEKGRLEIKRPAKFGGDVAFERYSDLEAAFAASKVHPADLKTSVAASINEMLVPVAAYFKAHPHNLEKVRGFKTTR